MVNNSQVSKKANSRDKNINLLSLSVVRRDGSITPFKSDKISNAIKKAFLAQTKIRNNKDNDKEEEDRHYAAGAFCTPFSNKNDDKRVYINSIGEGAIWIVNTNGNLENGDYIQTSDILGHGEKQINECLTNYTVAKITSDCDFNINSTEYKCYEFTDKITGNKVRKAFVGCIYHTF